MFILFCSNKRMPTIKLILLNIALTLGVDDCPKFLIEAIDNSRMLNVKSFNKILDEAVFVDREDSELTEKLKVCVEQISKMNKNGYSQAACKKLEKYNIDNNRSSENEDNEITKDEDKNSNEKETEISENIKEVDEVNNDKFPDSTNLQRIEKRVNEHEKQLQHLGSILENFIVKDLNKLAPQTVAEGKLNGGIQNPMESELYKMMTQ